MSLTIVVHGIPAPQGSKRHVGRGIMVESSKKVKPWRDAVRSDAVEAMALAGVERFDGPLVADMAFYFARPRSHFRTGRHSHLLRDGAPAAPASVPDLSKLVRSTEDALTEAGVWVDDARVVRCVAAKHYASAERPLLGAIIVLRQLGELAP